MHLFEIKLQFSDSGPESFILVVLHLLQQICRDTITFDVIRTVQPTPSSLSAVLNVISDDTFQRYDVLKSLGVKDPANVQANSSLQLWLISLTAAKQPLIQEAWAAYCRQRNRIVTPVPISLVSYTSASGLPPYPKFHGSTCGDLEMEFPSGTSRI